MNEAQKAVAAWGFFGIFLYLLLGAYFKNAIGVWFAVIWYIGVLLCVGAFVYLLIMNKGKKQNVKPVKIIDAQIVRKG